MKNQFISDIFEVVVRQIKPFRDGVVGVWWEEGIEGNSKRALDHGRDYSF